MPPPNKALYTNLTKQIFTAKAIPLPGKWSDMGDQFGDAFSLAERIAFPNPPTNLFREATLNKYHVDTAKDVGKAFADYIEAMCGAICDGIQNWMSTASISGVIINAVVGNLIPGNVIGPPLTPLILATGPKKTPMELKYTNAIATAFGNAWMSWSMGLTGILSYPAFAAFPGPVAPPMPNVPMPLIAFSSPGEAMLSPAMLKTNMIALHGDPTALHAADLFDAFGQGFTAPFTTFKATTMVKNVLGTGPIPTFAPPFVPVGPVLMGVGTGPPGCLS